MKMNILHFNQYLQIYLLGVSDSAKVNTFFFSSLNQNGVRLGEKGMEVTEENRWEILMIKIFLCWQSVWVSMWYDSRGLLEVSILQNLSPTRLAG